jgi:hypothetical protein
MIEHGFNAWGGTGADWRWPELFRFRFGGKHPGCVRVIYLIGGILDEIEKF